MNQRFHVIEITLQRPSARRAQPILGLRDAGLERLGAGDVLCLFELARNCVAAQGGLESEVESFIDGLRQQTHAFVPCRAVGFSLRCARLCGHEFAGRFIGVVVRSARLANGSADDAAFAGAIPPAMTQMEERF